MGVLATSLVLTLMASADGVAFAASSDTCDGISVAPGADIPLLAKSSPEGTRFCLEAGKHDVDAAIVPRSGQQFIGEPGAVLDGARPLNSFVFDGTNWVAEAPFIGKVPLVGECKPGYSGCQNPHTVFLDGQPLWTADELGDLSTGTTYVDRSNKKVYLGDDPSGRQVEVAVTDAAIRAGSPAWLSRIYHVLPEGESAAAYARNVVVRGLIVEKFANTALRGAVDSVMASGWVMEDNEIRLNHGVGVCGDTASILRRNFIHHNGQLGICGTGENLLVSANEVAYNGIAGFSSYWETGGSKWVRTVGLVVDSNNSHHNVGSGFWTDIDNIRTTYTNNVVTDNLDSGIMHEISYSAIIKGNTVSRNGFGSYAWNAGILVVSSPNVEVAGNRVQSNANSLLVIQDGRGDGTTSSYGSELATYGPYEVDGLRIHHNRITSRTKAAVGLVLKDVSNPAKYTLSSVRFAANVYRTSARRPFTWKDRTYSAAGWVRAGRDRTSTFRAL